MKRDAFASPHASALNPERAFLLKHIGFDRRIVKAQGHHLTDEHGHELLDFLSQYGAMPFGHNPPALWQALHRLHDRLEPSFVQPLLSPAAEALARTLVSMAPGSLRHVTFANSGAETVEAAIKLARARTGRPVILSTVRGFHGKTLGALSATDNPMYREPFHVDTQHFERVAYDDLPALEARLASGDVAAFLVEPVQGEGGMRTPTPGYLRAAQAACKAHGTLFVLDEIQTGLGRTGRLFAAEHEGLEPDILLLAKALGGGLVPLGAMLCTAAAWHEAFGYFHSSTFANSHFTCSVGLAVLAELAADDQAIVRHAAAMGEHLQAGLDALVQRRPGAFAARCGQGLMQALVLAPWDGEASYFIRHASLKGHAVPLLAGYLLAEHGIVTAPVFNQNATLRLEPPLTIGRDEIDRVLAALDRAAVLIEAGRFDQLLRFVADGPSVRGIEIASGEPAPLRVEPTWRAPRAWEKRRGRFAFLIHPTDEQVLFDTLPPNFAQLDAPRRGAWRAWMDSWFSRMHEPAPVYHLPALRSRQGGYVEGWLIAAPLTPMQMMRLRREQKAELLAAYAEVARSLDVDITGLGAFTSVISRGGTDLLDHGITLTTGNSLTAIASAESLRQASAGRGLDLARQSVAIIGAAGSIGRLVALHLGRWTRRLVLLGNPANPAALQGLQAVAGEVYRKAAQVALLQADPGLPSLLLEALGRAEVVRLLETMAATDDAAFRLAVEASLAARGHRQPPVLITVDLAGQLPRCGVVLSASAAGKSFVDPDLLAAGAVVCDVARPLDVLAGVKGRRDDVFVYEGGIMKLPEHVAFGAQNVLGYPRGYNLACLSETMVLAMDGARRHHSLGSQIDYDEALAIHDKARRHGFRPAVLVDGAPVPLQAAHGPAERPRPARAHAAATLGVAL